jgi:translation initiation factor 2-alpha kinase 4
MPGGGGTSRGRHNSFGSGNTSRYANDFTELGRLGKGGFGEVVKARNKLDGNAYAIKKITKIGRSRLNHILHEVMLLSRLNHKFVIRYFTAWLEEEGPIKQAISGESTDESGEDDEDSNDSYEEEESSGAVISSSGSVAVESAKGSIGEGEAAKFANDTGDLDFISGDGYPKIDFGDDSDDSDDSAGSQDDASAQGTNASGNERNASPEQPIVRRRSFNGRSLKSTLYIQMSLADRLASFPLFNLSIVGPADPDTSRP